ncbi:MAG: hypothetical protein U1A27_13920 [Phycisphaerae bacterium]
MNAAPADRADAPASPPRLARGDCFVQFVFDIGLSVDLDHAERLLGQAGSRAEIRESKRAPHAVVNQPAPLRFSRAGEPCAIAAFATRPAVDCVLHEFGAVSVTFSIPLAGPLDQLRTLSDRLYAHAGLAADARRNVEQILAAVRPAVNRPTLAEVCEDYALFHLAQLDPPVADAERFVSDHADLVAQILRAESAALSDAERRDALACRVSYGPADAVVVDWNAALVIDQALGDVRTILEFANVELLELRFLDRQLDRAAEQSYPALMRRTWRDRLGLGRTADALDRIARFQIDGALLFEGVNNALKLIGDQYLARVYRLASQRFHLSEWDEAILRKLETLDSIYGKLSDRRINVRMEILEWIIILLIFIEIVLAFVPGLKH